MANERTYRGSCFCGAVEIEVRGEPFGAGYCHCNSCRRWSAAPITAFTLWTPRAAAVVKGADQVVTYSKTPRSNRKWCKACGGHLFTEHPGVSLIAVYAATISGYPFKPGVHVHYQETVLRVRDGLPKLKDLPADWGGTGTRVAE